MADISITASAVAASATATTRDVTAGAEVTRGQAVIYDTASSKWVLADADAEATATGNNIGIALNEAGDGQPLRVVTRDRAGLTLSGMTIGEVYCISTTAGGIAPESDLLSGDFPCVLGVAQTASLLIFDPIPGGAAKP